MPRTERYDRYSWFDQQIASPLNGKVPGYDLRGAMLFTDIDTRSPFGDDRNNIQPRIGFAYALDNRTSVRGGYGIYYSVSNVSIASDFGPPFSVATNIQWSRDGGITPYATLANPFPDGVIMPSGKSAGTSTFIGFGPISETREWKTPQYQQWSFSIQRSVLRDAVVEINYVGTKGTHLPFGGLENINLLHPTHWGLGRTEINRLVANPFYGVITDPGSLLSTPTTQRSRLLVPFPQYTSVAVSQPYIANSI
jgi:hypothetical protein